MLRLNKDERGVALISVIIVATILGAFVTATSAYALKSLDLSRHDQDWNAALSAAEAGIDDYLFRLNRDENYWQYSSSNLPADGNEAFVGWESIPGAANEGEFRYDPDASEFAATGIIKITSTGRVLGTTRTVHATLRKRHFLDYLYFTEYETKDPAAYNTGSPFNDPFTPAQAQINCTRHYYDNPPRHSSCVNIHFFSLDVIKGPLHTNDALLISGSPQFLGDTSTSWNDPSGQRWREGQAGSAPVFARVGDPALAAELEMPPSNSTIKTHADAQQGGTGCLYTGPTSIQFNANGTMNVSSPLTISSNCGVGNGVAAPVNGVIFVQSVPADPTDPNYRATCPVSSGNPLGYPISGDITSGYGCFDGDAFVQGTVKGRYTVASEDNIIITGNTTYEGGTGGQDLLGLAANNYIQIYHPVNSSGNELASFTDVVVQAAMVSVKHSFTVQNYRTGSPRGNLSVYGVIAQEFRGPVGTFSGSSVSTGYKKDYVYDQRMKYLSPPYFIDPVKSAWGVATWAEVPPAY